MSVEKVTRKDGTRVWRVRWREGERGRSRVVGRKRDADVLDAEIRRRRRLGDLASLTAGTETLDEYVTGTWAHAHARHLAPKTLKTYTWAYDCHISPRLGHLPLRDLAPEVIARWQADLAAAGVGPTSARKAITLLGGILQRAAEGGRIPANPARLVRKAPLPPRREVRPYSPAEVEQLRLAVRQRHPSERRWGGLDLGHRDATFIALLAYAGLRPQEAIGLSWRDVRDRTLLVRAPKTRTIRTVRLLAPLAQDLAEWRLACGRPAGAAPVVIGADRERWTIEAYNRWRARTWTHALERAGLPAGTPYALRHSFASLLLHEGRSAVYVARQLGHGADLTLRTYGHVIDELGDEPRLPAEDAIRRAREQVGVRLVSATAR